MIDTVESVFGDLCYSEYGYRLQMSLRFMKAFFKLNRNLI